MDGWQKVGAGLGALFNPNAGEEAYRARLSENLTLEQKMAAAGQDRLRMMAIERIANDPNLDPFERDLLVGELGTQFSGVQQGRLREQEVGLRGEAFGRADAAGYGVNAPLIALANGPVEFNKALAGGNLQGNTYLPGSELAVTEIGPVGPGQGVAANCWRRLSANWRAPSRSVCGSSRQNSSPPMRPKTSALRRRCMASVAQWRNTASPAAWPWVSLTRLKWSRSNISRLAGTP